jgi:two-component system, chemotaxis family, chemotaxis protein CheY
VRALVVDDSRFVRLIVSDALRELGMEVVEAADGVAALAQLERFPDVSLMLLDWNMPEMDGLELLHKVRSQRCYDGLRILMVTAEGEGAQVTRALNAGANEYLMKPFSKEVLVAKLNLMDVLE